MYTIYQTKDGSRHLIKLYVEEALSKNERVVFNRAYLLKDIKKVADIPNGVHSKKGGLTDDTSATTYSIAELFDFAKQYANKKRQQRSTVEHGRRTFPATHARSVF